MWGRAPPPLTGMQGPYELVSTIATQAERQIAKSDLRRNGHGGSILMSMAISHDLYVMTTLSATASMDLILR